MAHLALEQTRVYLDAVEFAELIWNNVATWNQFARDTMGKQLVRAADSIGANIAESYGRYHFSERINFLYYARGSLHESKYWITLAERRKLYTPELAQERMNRLDNLALELNAYIKDKRNMRQSYKYTPLP